MYKDCSQYGFRGEVHHPRTLGENVYWHILEVIYLVHWVEVWSGLLHGPRSSQPPVPEGQTDPSRQGPPTILGTIHGPNFVVGPSGKRTILGTIYGPNFVVRPSGRRTILGTIYGPYLGHAWLVFSVDPILLALNF